MKANSKTKFGQINYIVFNLIGIDLYIGHETNKHTCVRITVLTTTNDFYYVNNNFINKILITNYLNNSFKP